MDDFKISIQQIEIFLVVAKCESISVAARKLYISQPAISKLMQQLEKTLGKQLLIRNNRGIKLSPDGELLYAELHNTYHKFRVTLERILLGGSTYRAPMALNLGCLNDPVAIYAMHAFIDLLKKQHPDLRTASEQYSLQELKEKLVFGELDIIFTFSGNDSSDGFETLPLYNVERFFWIPAEWSKPFEKPADLHFLKEKTLLLEIHTDCDEALSTCRAHGFEPKDIKYISSFLLLSYMVSRGEGFTIWDRYSPEVFRQRIRILPFMPCEGIPETSIVATWRSNDITENLKKAVSTLHDTSLRKSGNNPLSKLNNNLW